MIRVAAPGWVRDGVMFFEITLGSALFDQGEIEEADSLLEEADETARALDSKLAMARTACYLGRLNQAAGDGCAAKALLERSLELARSIDYQTFVAHASSLLEEVVCAVRRSD